MGISRVEVNHRQPYWGGKSFGEAGPYELIEGKAFFSVDPGHPDNSLIADIELAPRDDAGMVCFSAAVPGVASGGNKPGMPHGFPGCREPGTGAGAETGQRRAR